MDPFRIVRRDESAAQQDEAETKWGGSHLFKEVQRRTRRYTPADWALIRLEPLHIRSSFCGRLREQGARTCRLSRGRDRGECEGLFLSRV